MNPPDRFRRRAAPHPARPLALLALLAVFLLPAAWAQAQPVPAQPVQAQPVQRRQSAQPARPGPSDRFTVLAVPQAGLSVYDGDTFDADLDRDGRITPPRERVRLLFVDTPELEPVESSGRPQDLAHGLPAREFLAERLRRGPVLLWVPKDRPVGTYGRTLGLVMAGGESVNLALIRAGHSHFVTRFALPADYRAYVAAEAAAFQERLGIWRERASRERYLQRLQKRELKTPEAPGNPRYVAQVQQARTFRPQALRGKYIHLQGTLAGRALLSKGVRKLDLARDATSGTSGAGGPRGTFTVIFYGEYAERLGVDRWPTGSRVQVDGFVKEYKGALELLGHYGFPVP